MEETLEERDAGVLRGGEPGSGLLVRVEPRNTRNNAEGGSLRLDQGTEAMVITRKSRFLS